MLEKEPKNVDREKQECKKRGTWEKECWKNGNRKKINKK